MGTLGLLRTSTAIFLAMSAFSTSDSALVSDFSKALQCCIRNSWNSARSVLLNSAYINIHKK